MFQEEDVESDLRRRLTINFKHPEARHIYAEELTNAVISEQMLRLREDRKLTQEDLAKLIGTRQSAISRLQARDYSSWRVDTLRKIAKAFDVRLRISFAEFGTVIDDIYNFNEEMLLPRKFADDPAFFEEESPEKNEIAKGRSNCP